MTWLTELSRPAPNGEQPSLLCRPYPVWIILYLLFAIVSLLSINGDHDWGGDFALYITHAKNLAEGNDYSLSTWAYSPDQAGISPRSYPPGLPLFLAPVYGVVGLNIAPLKAVTVLCLLVSLLLIFSLFQRTYGPAVAVGSAALLALNPHVWVSQEKLLSEFPFMLLGFLALIAMERRTGLAGWKIAAMNIVSGILIYATYATRVQGIVLLIAVVICDSLQRPKTLHRTAILVAAFALLWIVPPVEFGNLSTYGTAAENLEISQNVESSEVSQGLWSVPDRLCVSCTLTQALAYFENFGEQSFTRPEMIYRVMSGGLLVLVLVGFVFRHLLPRDRTSAVSKYARVLDVLRSFSIGEVYSAGLIALALLLPNYALRYIMPVLPFMFAYALLAGERLSERWTSSRTVVAELLLLVMLGGYGVRHLRLVVDESIRPAGLGVTSVESQEMFSFVREGISNEELVAFQKPRPLALFTSQPSTLWGPHEETENGGGDPPLRSLLEHFLERNVAHLIVHKSALPGLPAPHPTLTTALTHEAFELEYSNRHFSVLRFNPERARQSLADPASQ